MSKEGIVINSIQYQHLVIRDCGKVEIIRPVKAEVDFNIKSLNIKGEFDISSYLDKEELEGLISRELKESIKVLEGTK